MGFMDRVPRSRLIDEILVVVEENPGVDLEKISERVELSEEGVRWFLRELCRRGDLGYAEIADGSGGRKLGLFRKVVEARRGGGSAGNVMADSIDSTGQGPARNDD